MARKRIRTQTNNQFAEVVNANVPRSTFWRNSSLKTSFNAGKLVPIYLDEVLPGDTIEMDMASVSRLTTPIFPTMDTAYLDFYAFFVPNRLVWDGWEELIANTNKTGAWAPETPPALVPAYGAGALTIASVPAGSIGDYYGLPVNKGISSIYGYEVSALPFRGYALIWNEWFRDENLQAPLVINKGNSVSTGDVYSPANSLFSVNKKHDYFTSALPAPQKGDSVLIPIELQEYLPVIVRNLMHDGGSSQLKWFDGANEIADNGMLGIDSDGTVSVGTTGTVNSFVRPANLWADTGGQISDATISELRTAFQIQKLFERDARGGTRYVEMLKAHFGVDAQDYRLQRPEFLGHRSTMIGIQQVAQTSSTDTTSPQGNLAAFSYTLDQGVLFKKSFVEHGYIHIFAVARQPKTYQNGVPKLFTKRERLDFYVPVLAHISEQPILNKEIYLKSGPNALNYNEGVFGYQEAWAEYRYKPNQVTGQMRSGVSGSLDAWHYADNYTSEVYLSDAWIKDNSQANIDRTLAVSSSVSNQIIMDIAFKNKSTRPMPLRSIPGMVDHF